MCGVHIASILFTVRLPFHQNRFTYNIWTLALTNTHTNRRNYACKCSSCCCTRNYWILCTVFIEEMVRIGHHLPNEWENNNNNLRPTKICEHATMCKTDARTEKQSLNISIVFGFGKQRTLHSTGRFEWNPNGKWESRAPTTYRKLRTVFRDLQAKVDVVQLQGHNMHACAAISSSLSARKPHQEMKKRRKHLERNKVALSLAVCVRCRCSVVSFFSTQFVYLARRCVEKWSGKPRCVPSLSISFLCFNLIFCFSLRELCPYRMRERKGVRLSG